MSTRRVVTFGRFQFDPASGELREAGSVVRLRHQSTRVLGMLLERPGELVTRETLRSHLWGADTFVDFDQGLNHCIKEIRSALGDAASAPSYVETLPRRGYRWIALLAPEPQPSPARPAAHRTDGRPRSSRGLAVLAAAAALLALAAWVERPHASSRDEDARWQRLTYARGRVSSARVLPDGGFAWLGAWEGAPQRLETSGTRWPGLADGTMDWLVGVTPGGEAFTLYRGVLSRVRADGTGMVLARGVLAADVSRDGAIVAASVLRGDGPEATIELPLGRPVGRLGNPSLHVRLSPDGRRLAVTDHPIRGQDAADLVVFDDAGRRTLGPAWTSLQGLAWRTNHEVWVTGSRTGVDNALVAVNVVTGREREVFSGGGRLTLHDVAADGRVLIERTAQRQHVVFGRAGERERDLTIRGASHPADLSDDGRLLLMGDGDESGASQSAYVRGTDGSPPVRLAAGRPLGFAHGATAALVAPEATPDRIEVVPLDPAGRTRTYRAPGIPAFRWAGAYPGSADRLLFASTDGRSVGRLYHAPLEGGPPVALTPEGVTTWRNHALSPDGRRLVAQCPDGRGFCVFDAAVTGVGPALLLGGAWPVRWDASGRRLFVYERDGQRAHVYAIDPRDGRREALFTLTPHDPVGVLRISEVVLTPDGRAWAYMYLRRLSELFVVRGLASSPGPREFPTAAVAPARRSVPGAPGPDGPSAPPRPVGLRARPPR